MKTRLLTLVAALGATTIVLAGCNGPTKAGLEARADAKERINAFSSQFTYDQALQDLQAGRFESAHRNVDSVLQQYPENAEYLLLKGRICFEQNELERALEWFAQSSVNDPELADPHYYTGIVHQRWSDDEAALAAYRTAYELDNDRPELLLACAETHLSLGHHETARTMVEERLNFFEHSPALRHLLAQIALLEGDDALGAKMLEEAALLDPDNTLLLEELAYAQYDAGKFGKCLNTLETLDRRSGEPRFDLMHVKARCLTMLDRTVDAHKLYQQLVREMPDTPSVWIDFGTLAWKVGDYRRVAECSVRIISLAPERYEGYLLKGLYERHQGRTQSAIDLLTKAADRADDTPLPALLLAQTLNQEGQIQAAYAVCADAVARFPDSNDAKRMKEMLQEKLRTARAE